MVTYCPTLAVIISNKQENNYGNELEAHSQCKMKHLSDMSLPGVRDGGSLGHVNNGKLRVKEGYSSIFGLK